MNLSADSKSSWNCEKREDFREELLLRSNNSKWNCVLALILQAPFKTSVEDKTVKNIIPLQPEQINEILFSKDH